MGKEKTGKEMEKAKRTEQYSIAPIKQKKKKVQERKLAKKTKRPKRRYILFSLAKGKCSTGRQALELVMAQFVQDERKELGTWFIEFNPETGLGIIRCKLAFLKKVKDALNKISGAKTLKTSGTLKALKSK